MSDKQQVLSRVQVWYLAARPKTLWAAAAPVIVGCALAFRDSVFHLPSAIGALVGALLIQIGTNYANDLHDFEKGTDSSERIGPLRVTQAGLVTPGQMKRAVITVFALAVVVGFYLILRGGIPILVFGVLAIISGIAYTAGPWPLGYVGLGEVFVFAFFGLFAVVGTYWVQAQSAPPAAWLAAVPMGLLSSAVLVVNNLRDLEGDRRAGKRTLAVRLGSHGARAEYVALIFLALTVPIVAWIWEVLDAWILLSCLVLIPAAFVVCTVLKSTDGPSLNRALAQTARLQLLYALTFAVGLLL